MSTIHPSLHPRTLAIILGHFVWAVLREVYVFFCWYGLILFAVVRSPVRTLWYTVLAAMWPLVGPLVLYSTMPEEDLGIAPLFYGLLTMSWCFGVLVILNVTGVI